MKIEEVNQIMQGLQRGLEAAISELVVLPGYQGVRITARFHEEGGRKGHDILLDNHGNVTVQPQNYTRSGGDR